MKKNIFNTKTNNQSGFTLVETLVAIFILAMTIGVLLTLTAGGFFTIRYAKNDIVATNLLQESLEYIRNDRDSSAQAGTSWTDWVKRYSDQGCLDADRGCIINPYADSTQTILACERKPLIGSGGGCPNINYYTQSGFYGYNNTDSFNQSGSTSGFKTSFIRTINMKLVNNDNDLLITAKMFWQNGNHDKNLSQSMILSKWNMP